MELDARRLAEGACLDADLCIIGAGPAGIAVAREFLGRDIDVLLLESGGWEPDERVQRLNEGRVVGDVYAGLRSTRHRQIGGTARIWNTPVGGFIGAKFVPLDPWDFDRRESEPLGEWPISPGDLHPWYRRAQVVCGLGPPGYGAADWPDPDRPPLPLTGELLASRVYQFGRGRPFTETYPRQIRESSNVRLMHGATVCRLAGDGAGRRVSEALFASRPGWWHTVRARAFVLAGGAIENSRLLLLSELGGDMVGRCFMEHPRDHALTLRPRSEDLFLRAGFYDAHTAPDGTVICGRLALTSHAVRNLGLPNASLTLLPNRRVVPSPSGLAGKVLSRLRELVERPHPAGYGWSREPAPTRVYDGFRILVNFEQRPHPGNRVVLGPDLDDLGSPRAELHWRWRAEEQAGLERLRTSLVKSLEESGVGRVGVDTGQAPDPNAHHHAGTTRMSRDPAFGVVDPDCRVHGMENLYVAGASVFPTAGFANPTLTCVALALRLAAHLEGLFKPGRPVSTGVEEPG